MTSAAALWAPPVWTAPEPEPPPPDFLVWQADEPTVYQASDWTCSCAAAAWVMNTLGVPDPVLGGEWTEWSAVSELRRVCGYGAVTPEYGLAYADMSELEEMYRAQGLLTERRINVGFWELASDVAGLYPGQLNGARWFHHAGLRGFTGSALTLANPAPTWRWVGQVLDQTEWAVWGVWNVLYVVGRN
jgi:hypothetical protein